MKTSSLRLRRRSATRRVLGCGLVAGAALALPAGAVAAAPGVTEFSAGLSPNSFARGITAGPDGNLWFAGTRRVGRVTPAGAITEFPLATFVNGITTGPDGNLWITELDALDKGGRIGVLTPAGILKAEHSAGVTAGVPLTEIVSGPDGNLWFGVSRGGTSELANGDIVLGLGAGQQTVAKVGRVTPAGVITEFTAGISQDKGLGGIGAGPDGNVWFVEPGGRIGRITPTGAVQTFPVKLGPGVPFATSIVSGPDGNLWFTSTVLPEAGVSGRIGRITPSGVVTYYGPGQPRAAELSGRLAVGADGNLWFASTSSSDRLTQAWSIRRITPAGVVTEFGTGLALGSRVTSIARGPDGNLWFTENVKLRSSRIGRFNPAVAQPALALGVAAPSARAGAVTVRLACPATARQRCTGAATLLAPPVIGSGKRAVIGKTVFSIGKGRRPAVTVTLNAAGQTFLKRLPPRNRKARATLWVNAKDASGRSRQVTLDVTIPVAPRS